MLLEAVAQFCSLSDIEFVIVRKKINTHFPRFFHIAETIQMKTWYDKQCDIAVARTTDLTDTTRIACWKKNSNSLRT